MSVEVKAQNSISMTSIKAIKDATDQSAQLLATMEQYAQQAGTTLTGIYQDAEDAKANAQNASEYASRALGNLSTVQSVAETLNWITQHGTMALTQDTAPDPSHVYFVLDAQGDYIVGGTHYSIVTEPNTADMSTYYELTIDESLNNYVGTHLAVDSEGLWLIPEANGNKVLIATGSGNTYTTAGTYIIGKDNGTDVILAQFLSNSAVIGQTDNVHVEIDEDSFLMLDGSGTEFAHIGSPKGAQVTDTFVYAGTDTFTLSNTPSGTVTVQVNGTTTTNFTLSGTTLTITRALTEGDRITATYTVSAEIKYYSMGLRIGDAGKYSMAEGYNTTASGMYSHAEGRGTFATGAYSHAEGYGLANTGIGFPSSTRALGDYSHAEGYGSGAYGTASHAEGNHGYAGGVASHAEGYNTFANGNYSHAQNEHTYAQAKGQTALGTYNVSDTTTATTHPNGDAGYGSYAVIIGNGTALNARNNALAVTWDGNVELDLAGYQTAGNVDKTIYDALVALGWDSEVTA